MHCKYEDLVKGKLLQGGIIITRMAIDVQRKSNCLRIIAKGTLPWIAWISWVDWIAWNAGIFYFSPYELLKQTYDMVL